MVWGTLVFTVFEMMLNILYARRFISYTLQEQLRDTLPSALLSGFMFLCITLAGQLPLTLSPLVWLLLKIVLGIVIYTSTAQLLKLEGWRETTAIIRQLFKHHKP